MTTIPSTRPSTEVAAAFLDQLQTPRPAATVPGRGRLIFALDATASREPTWDRACHIQHAMFDAAATLGGLETQLVFYHGYNRCQTSRWLTSPQELHRVMSKVACVGGETQIERVLSHAIRETRAHKVNAVVFVGDAMEEKTDRLCRLAGELGDKAVPLFIFQEGEDPNATTTFKQMACLSKGAHLAFNLGNINRLKELLAAVAVYAAGGYRALEAYGKQKGGEALRLTAQLRE